VGPWPAGSGVGWQPSRFLVDRAEAERAFALAERLCSINAAAAQLGTTWPSLQAFTRHGLSMPAHNPDAIRQRAIHAAHKRHLQPLVAAIDPVFVRWPGSARAARPPPH
jgi:hypothetical protein